MKITSNFTGPKNEATVKLYTDVSEKMFGHRAQTFLPKNFAPVHHYPMFIENYLTQFSLHSPFIWFAPNTLHIQSFHSLQKLYADSAKLNCIDLNELSSDPVLNPHDLLFVNWSSVDGLKKIWRKENENNTNLETLVENTKANGTQIILVIDEAHLSAFTGLQAISVRKLIKAKIEISVTATPRNRPQRTVFISRQEVVEQEMIKKGVRLNIGLNPEEQNGENLHIHLLRKAFAKKKELEKYYNEELGENVINPLLIIQLPTDTIALSDEDASIRDTLESLLAMEFNITKQNGRLAVWLSGERDKDGLEEPNGLQDVLIFKQAIAQGWDCPRAAVLVSYRNVQSPDFGIQTVGRILRMPHQKHYLHDDLNYGYVYTNIESARINLVPSDSDYFNLQYSERKRDSKLVFDKIAAFSIVNDRASKGLLTSAFEKIFFELMEEKYGVEELPEIELGGSDADDLHGKIELNKKALAQKNWQFEIDDHQIHIPTDINLDPYEVDSIILNTNQLQDFAITMAQFGEMFDRFCYDNITRLNRSKSWKKLREVLIHFAEYYLNIFEFEARRIFLFPYNKALLIQDLSLALERFEAFQTAQGNESRRTEEEEWQVPEIRYYNDLYNREQADKYAMVPFFESNKASTVEVLFKSFLEQNKNSIEWWYKNGDKGKEHFSIPYTNLQNELRLFYVDFVVKFTSGKIGLFDTKTKRSDLDAPSKHNALIAYIEEQNKNNKRRTLLAGVIIPEEINGIISFRYCPNRISDTNNLTGWEFLNPMGLGEKVDVS